MSISTSLSNAISGMSVASRRTEIISSNIANSLTDGYARRDLDIGPRNSGGVQALGVQREVNNAIIGDRRTAESDLADLTQRSESLARIERAIGTPDTAGSLTDLVNRFESALIDATSRPDSDTRLENVRLSALRLTQGLNDASQDIQDTRTAAEQSISSAVDTLNASIERVDQLNNSIARATAAGRDASGLLDQRQAAIDSISDLVPIREYEKEFGRVALITTSNLTLIDGYVNTFEFSPAPIVTADLTLGSSALSLITLDGEDVPVDALGNGKIAALFAVRDDIAPEAQDSLDGFARDLMERYEDASIDTTRAATDPGLFTDAGALFDPLSEVGLADRITVNTAYDPAAGGSVTLLRDGLGATVPGPTGEAGLLNRMLSVLNETRSPSSASLTGTAKTSTGLAAEIVSNISMTRQFTDASRAEAAASTEAFRALERADGVDTDAELQDLLLIEKAYAANARVIQTADEMLRELLEI